MAPRAPRVYYGEEIHGKTVGVLGLGAIGRELAAVWRCLGMRTLGVSPFGRAPLEQLRAGRPVRFHAGPPLDMLPLCDFVVVALPLTPETTGLIGEAALRAMKPTAHLVNVARGRIVDQDFPGPGPAGRLDSRRGPGRVCRGTAAARERAVGSAQPGDNPPHGGGHFAAYLDRVTDILAENLRRFAAGEPMVNLLDQKGGY